MNNEQEDLHIASDGILLYPELSIWFDSCDMVLSGLLPPPSSIRHYQKYSAILALATTLSAFFGCELSQIKSADFRLFLRKLKRFQKDSGYKRKSSSSMLFVNLEHLASLIDVKFSSMPVYYCGSCGSVLSHSNDLMICSTNTCQSGLDLSIDNYALDSPLNNDDLPLKERFIELLEVICGSNLYQLDECSILLSREIGYSRSECSVYMMTSQMVKESYSVLFQSAKEAIQVHKFFSGKTADISFIESVPFSPVFPFSALR